MSEGRIVVIGDSAVRVELEDRIDPAVNATAVALAAIVESARLPGIRDVVPTFRSVTVYFDPLRTNYDALLANLSRALADAAPASIPDREPIRIPVCYEGEYAPDLGAVAAFAGITLAEAIRLHTSRTYRVFMLGFVPGFAYMGSVDERIAMPRLPVPRTRVPVGAVGIAGPQTGVYSAATPGGWRIVGQTPLRPFDPDRAEPFLFKPGDAVQFYAIDPDDFSQTQDMC